MCLEEVTNEPIEFGGLCPDQQVQTAMYLVVPNEDPHFVGVGG